MLIYKANAVGRSMVLPFVFELTMTLFESGYHKYPLPWIFSHSVAEQRGIEMYLLRFIFH